MIEFLTNLTTIVAVFGLLDLFLSKSAKSAASDYLFGLKEVSFQDFSFSHSRSIIGIFYKDKIQIRRVILFSLVSLFVYSVYFSYLGLLNSGSESFNGTVSAILFFFVLIIPTVFISVPFDLFSIEVSRYIFNKYDSSFHLCVLFDFIVSIIPSVAALFILIYFKGLDFNKCENGIVCGIIFATLLANTFSVVMINLAQIALSVAALISRFVSSMVEGDKLVIEKSTIVKYPFTFVGVLVGVLFGVLL